MKADFAQVTERWEMPASPEQLAMQYCRYQMAADLSAGKEVLEIGCGTGMGLAYLVHRAKRAVGMDISSDLLQEARSHLPDVELREGDASALPFVDGSFDVVLMLEMLYYLPDVDRALEECRRILRRRGSLMICLPNRDRPDFNPSPFAFQYPNAPELAGALKRHGFEPAVYGGFPIDAESSRDRLLRPVRHLAVRLHLIPRSMRVKAMVKRLLYGQLPTMEGVREGMAEYLPPVELDPPASTTRFKNLYAIGTRT
jgi:ubiquinone/menaquinone biosynthesis C-methylase UbiE